MKIFRFQYLNRKINARYIAFGITTIVVMLATAAFGDVVDDSLPPDTPQAVKASARQAIRSGLDQDSVARITQAMLQHRFDGQQIRHAHTLMIEAHDSGMPVEELMNKAYEGMAKGVDPPLIVGAMERVQARHTFAYRHAAQLSGNKSDAANLGYALSSAMAAGFEQQDADRVTQMIRQRAHTMQPDEAYNLALECFYTARDVSRLGVSSGAVAQMLDGALEKGFRHQEMHAMRHAFMNQARYSQPQDLAHSYTRAIREGRGFQEGMGSGAAGSGMGMGAGESKAGMGGSGGPGGSGPGHGRQ